jgi:membrane protease YdiL (CAAX protease family)
VKVYSLGIETNSSAQWVRLLLGLTLVFVLFQWSADVLQSDRGQAGLIVGTLIVSATLVVERILFGQRVLAAARALGLGRPRARGLLASAGTCLLLLLLVPLFVQSTGTSIDFFPGWITLVPGLFAQAGIAEETLFRGYLFRHVRSGRSFWRAAGLSTLPFVSVHLLLFASMPGQLRWRQ